MVYSVEKIKKAILDKKYAWFDGPREYNINIIGIRNSSTGKRVTNVFDDLLTVSFVAEGKWQYFEWPITTDPGRKAVVAFNAKNGVARLVPGQYLRSHSIRKHKNEYDALCQDTPLKVFRDSNKDMTFDEKIKQEGVFGINIHRSNPRTESLLVENWSEGCQVFRRRKDFDDFMNICRKSRDLYGNKFTYTLIESSDIK